MLALAHGLGFIVRVNKNYAHIWRTLRKFVRTPTGGNHT
jgi:hypothetical protein